MRFATLYISDFPVWVVELFEPSLRGRDIIVQLSGRVAARSERLAEAGIQREWAIERARAQAPDATVRAHPGARTRLAWDLILEALTRRTPWVEPRLSGEFIHVPTEARLRARIDALGEEGMAVLGLEAREGRHDAHSARSCDPGLDVQALARAVRARVGVAGDRATSFLAALQAPHGSALVVPDRDSATFRGHTPLALTEAAGISPDTCERLRWLGFHTVGQLRRLTPIQLRAQLSEGDALHALGRADDRRPVSLFVPPPSVHAEHSAVTRLVEPGEWEPLVDALLLQCMTRLENRDVQMVRVSMSAGAKQRAVRRLSHEPTSDLRGLTMLARMATRDVAPYFPEGVDGVVVTLEGLVPAIRRQALLWGEERATLNRALEALEKRVPGASLRVVGLDADAYLPEEAFQLLPIAAASPPRPRARVRR